ncbi:MAG: 3-deoxy-7-phosphoheptulonate synthase [Flavobacteriales bacterium]
MIIQLKKDTTQEQKQEIKHFLDQSGYKATEVKTQIRDYLVANGSKPLDIRGVGQLQGVQDVHYVSDPYQLVSGKWKIQATEIPINHQETIGRNSLTIMAGPCAIEDEQQIRQTLEHLTSCGIKIMRGGAFKPRSSPYSFRGLGLEGLKLWHQLAKEYGVSIITEVMQVSQIEQMYDYVDIFQVGARNTQNFNLLEELGKVDKPVLLKRGISGTIDELLYSAEYIFSAGNEKLILCERGIRTFETSSRNTLDLNAIPILKEKTHLPVVVDPSHGIGIRAHVEPMALAAVMAGADGIIYETHPCPEKASSDGQQTLNFDESRDLVRKLNTIWETRNKLQLS